MELIGIYDSDVLHKIGATSVWVDHHNNKTTIEPSIDISNYELVRLRVTKENKLKEIRNQAQNLILEHYPLWYQTNIANGIYPVLVADKMKSDIASVIESSNTAEDSVNSAVTIDEVNAVQPLFPVIGG